ncbi:MAG: hypothetical protein J7L75_02175 [Thermoproteales archaeon]|nr:hypothetical protein [Thermoproteales archaeon]
MKEFGRFREELWRRKGEDVEYLREVSERLELLYPLPLVVELVSKAAKEASKRGFSGLPPSARRVLELILSGVFVTLVAPSPSL